jgi:transposase-like protein
MKKYGGEEKAWFVEEWEKSGKSKRAFAQELGLNVQTFTNWTRKGTAGQGFVELTGKPEQNGGNAGTAFVATGEALISREIVVERGEIKIRLPVGVTRTELALAIQALR